MQVISKTHVGMVRDNNEDSLLIRKPYLFAVADGMGGYAAGEIASRETLKAFEAATYELRHAKESGDKATEAILQNAFAKANAHVYKMAVSNEAYTGMGTTLTVLYLPGGGDHTAYAAHVGDSRLYLFRSGVLSQVTRDHSYVADLLAKGEITDSEAFTHPKRNILLAAIGVEESVSADIFHFALEDGDRLLICSDGLSDMLRDEEIASVMGLPLEAAADDLLKRSLEKGGKDNVSLILIDWNDREDDCNG